jgi:hypothetical protein
MPLLEAGGRIAEPGTRETDGDDAARQSTLDRVIAVAPAGESAAEQADSWRATLGPFCHTPARVAAVPVRDREIRVSARTYELQQVRAADPLALLRAQAELAASREEYRLLQAAFRELASRHGQLAAVNRTVEKAAALQALATRGLRRGRRAGRRRLGAGRRALRRFRSRLRSWLGRSFAFVRKPPFRARR